MSTEVRLPGLGESIAEGTIVRWFKQVGDPVARDEDLLVVSTDKIETEVPAPLDGVLLAIHAEAGATVEVGALIAVLGEAGEAVQAPARPAAGSARSTPPASAAPPVARQREARPTAPPSVAEPGERNLSARATGDLKLFVSPVVRRLAREHDINLGEVVGTGRGGRVSRRDLEAFVAGGGAGSGFVPPPGGYVPGLKMPAGGFGSTVTAPFAPTTPARHAPEVFEGDTVEPLSPLGRAMAEHMAWTWWRAPHVSTLVEVDMHRLAAFRRERAASGSKPSYTLCIAHAVAQALTRHRGFNSSLTDDHQRIVHREVNLGIAVARPGGGLVVPVIHGAGRMSLEQLGAALADRIAKARTNRLVAADLQGGTFTITNVGSNGNLASMPLINQPQVGILAIGAIVKRVVVVTDAAGDDAMAIRPMMYVTLTYDHRANDGAASGRFLRDLREAIEQWS